MKKSKLLVIILTLTIAFSPVIAFAGRCFQRNVRSFQSFHQPIQAISFPSVSYFVGAPIRIESLVQQELQQYQQQKDQEYNEFLQFQAWKQQNQQIQQIQANTQPQPQSTLVQQFCSKCHKGATPKGEFSIDGTFTAIERDKAARQVILGQMPKDKELTPAEKGSLVKEILLLGIEK